MGLTMSKTKAKRCYHYNNKGKGCKHICCIEMQKCLKRIDKILKNQNIGNFFKNASEKEIKKYQENIEFKSMLTRQIREECKKYFYEII